MKVIALGSSAAFPGPGEACSGYLIEQTPVTLLLDMGTGVLSNLQKYSEVTQLSAIVISHMHPDHFLDLIPLRYALRYGNYNLKRKIKVFLPPGGLDILCQTVVPFAESESFFQSVFEMTEYNPSEKLIINGLSLSFTAVEHYIRAWGVTLKANNTVAYSADTRLCPGIFEVARESDLFICNIGPDAQNNVDINGHLSPQQAGLISSKAGVKRLWISHLWPGSNPQRIMQETSAEFKGTIAITRPGLKLELDQVSQ
jgi:ribonuclease BN (tRNA processing enzyme)